MKIILKEYVFYNYKYKAIQSHQRNPVVGFSLTSKIFHITKTYERCI